MVTPKVLAPTCVSGGSFANRSSGVGESSLEQDAKKRIVKNVRIVFFIF